MKQIKFSKKPGAKEKRYQQIIDAAETILVQKGYENATFNDFAEAANYNKRTLYLYFPDKDDLFAAVVLRILTRLETHVNSQMNPTNNGLHNVLEITNAYFSFFFINKNYYNLIWSFEEKYFIFSENKHKSPNINKSYHLRRKNIQLLYDVYQKGLTDRSITVKQEPPLIISLLWGQTLGILQLISRGEYILVNNYKIDAEKLFIEHLKCVEERLTK